MDVMLSKKYNLHSLLCITILFFFSVNDWSRNDGTVADGSVDSNSGVSGSPIASLRSVTFPACCGISHVVYVFKLRLLI